MILQLVCSLRNENCLFYCVLQLCTRLWSRFFVVESCAVILFWWCTQFFFKQSLLLIMCPAIMWVTFSLSYFSDAEVAIQVMLYLVFLFVLQLCIMLSSALWYYFDAAHYFFFKQSILLIMNPASMLSFLSLSCKLIDNGPGIFLLWR